MDQNAFGHLIPGAQPQQPQQPRFPGVIQGAPKIDKPDAPKTTYRPMTPDEVRSRGLNPGQTYQISSEGKVDALGSDMKPTEGQGKSAGFLLRALQADDAYRAQDIGARSYVGQTLSEYAPDMLNTMPESVGNSPRRQVADSNQNEFVAATLRYESGAAIPPAELNAQKRRYFPVPGDSKQEIANKANLRATALEALKQSSGPLVGDTLAKFQQLPKTGKADDAESLFGDGDQGGLVGGVTDEGPRREGEISSDPSGGAPSGGGGAWSSIGAGVGDVISGALNNTVGLVSNPVANTIGQAMGYAPTSNLGESVRAALGLPQGNPTASAIIQGATGGMSIGGLARQGARMATGATGNALATLGATPVRDAVAGAGAVMGGQAVDAMGGGPVAQVAGGLAGGLAGYRGAGAVANRALGQRTPNALMQSADDLGVQMLPADVGGVGTRMATGAFGRTLGGIPLAEGAQTSVNSAAAARSRIASNIGEATDNAGGGQSVKRGFDAFTKSSEKRATELYDKISVDPKSTVALTNTRTALDEVTKGFKSNAALSKLWTGHPRLKATLEALTPTDTSGAGQVQFRMASQRLTAAQDAYDQLRNQVVPAERLAQARQAIDDARNELDSAQITANRPPEGGQLSWEDMKRFRTIVGEIVGQPGLARDGSDIAVMRKLYKALSSDMEVTAAQAGPRALTEFRRATQYFRGREARIDNVFAALLGKDGQRSDEAVFRQINQWAQGTTGDFKRVAQTIRSMPEDEASTIRATLVQRMGMAPARRQDVTQEVFSPAEFAAQWNGMAPRAKSALFPNQQHRQDLDKLAGLMDGMKRANEYQNFSNTSLGTNLTAQGLLAWANLPAALGAALVQFGAGKLLASPRFARAIASTYKLPEAVGRRKLTEQLNVVATREPLIANDVKSVLEFVNKGAAQSPTSAAAQDEPNGGRVPPQQ
jgi:hypothetical protein